MTGNANLWSWKGKPVNKYVWFSHMFNVSWIRYIFIPQAVRWFLLKGFHSTWTSGLPVWRDKREDQTCHFAGSNTWWTMQPNMLRKFERTKLELYQKGYSGCLSEREKKIKLFCVQDNCQKPDTKAQTGFENMKTKCEGKRSVCPHVSKCACKTRALQI